MKVYFPHGGRWRMLRWWEQNKGHHVIMARTHKGIFDSVQTLINEEPFSEIRGYWEIDIWAPSPEMVAMDKAIMEHEVRDDFWNYILWTAKDYFLDEDKPLPAGLKKCPKFEQDEEDKENGNNKEIDSFCHTYCRNCNGRKIIFDIENRETFYQERREIFETSKYNRRPPKSGIFSRATPAKNDQPLRMAIANFGHHCSGVELTEFKMPEAIDEYRPAGFSNNVLFFYTIVKKLGYTKLTKLAKDAKNVLKEERKKQSDQYKLEREQETKQRLANFLALMKGPTK